MAAAQGTISSTPISVIACTASSPRSPLAMPCTTTSRGSGGSAWSRAVMVTSTVPRPTPVTDAVAMPPRPSASVSRSPTRSRCTVAAWCPSAPASVNDAPVGRASTRKKGADTSERYPTTTWSSVAPSGATGDHATPIADRPPRSWKPVVARTPPIFPTSGNAGPSARPVRGGVADRAQPPMNGTQGGAIFAVVGRTALAGRGHPATSRQASGCPRPVSAGAAVARPAGPGQRRTDQEQSGARTKADGPGTKRINGR